MAFNITGGSPARVGDAPVNYREPRRCSQKLAPGTVIAVSDTNAELINVHGAGRIRIIANVAGQATTLRGRWRLADNITDQTVAGAALPFADVALVAGTENFVDIAANPGHAYLEVQIVNGGVGAATVTYVDVFMTSVGN